MTARELSAIAKKVNCLLPDYTLKGSLLFKLTPEAILLGLCFDGSSRDSRLFRGNAFLLPLFVPTETIHFNYSKRITPKIGQWNADDPNLVDALTAAIRNEGIPFFDAVSTLKDAADFIRPMLVPNVSGYVNPHSQEALAYTLIKLNDVPGALAVLSQMQKTLTKSTVEWELAIAARARTVEQKLLESPATALAQLDTWKDQTIRQLKLENYRS